MGNVNETQQPEKHDANDDMITCICGEKLKLHFEYLACDMCDIMTEATEGLYHCGKGRTRHHPEGYDICKQCFKSVKQVIKHTIYNLFYFIVNFCLYILFQNHTFLTYQTKKQHSKKKNYCKHTRIQNIINRE